MALNRHLYKRNFVALIPVFSAFFIGVLFTMLIENVGYDCESKLMSPYLPENSYFLILLVISAPGNILQRNTIRETWLNLRPKIINESYQNEIIYIPEYNHETGFFQLEPTNVQEKLLKNYINWMKKDVKNIKVVNFKIKHLFAIGTKNLNQNDRKTIDEEQRIYGDILEIDDVFDSYQNLTQKLLKSIKMIHDQFDFKYLMKLDDDTYLKLDVLSEDLLNYYEKYEDVRRKTRDPILELYWGFFNGRASVKKAGQWKETNFNLCDRYLPYALGGGYVISKNLATFIAQNHANLNTYVSEDISMGNWMAPFKNVHKRHDVRFDTAYMARKCKKYHIVLHKRNPEQMRELYKGKLCTHELPVVQERKIKRPLEYFYDWTQSPTKCCEVLVS